MPAFDNLPRSAIDARTRTATIHGCEHEIFDLLIIGAGITGAGVARDAAMRGLKVLLLDANDFAAGTSSRSSKMVHGGLRYLAQGNVRLVQEAASERLHVRRIAPHLAQLEAFVLPYRSLAARAKLTAGLVMFEKLGDVPRAERHEFWSKAELDLAEPALCSEQMKGAVVYNECLTDDARLTLANLRSARAHGAEIVSYMKVTSLLLENGEAVGVVAESQLPEEEISTTFKARQVVNAAGPWVDQVLNLEGDERGKKLQLTKGVHFVVRHEVLPVNRTIIVPASDKRNVFAVPRDGYTYFGTSDTFHGEATYWPEIDIDSIEYLVDACNRSFGDSRVELSDIESAWSGVRPLIAQAGKPPSEISREEELWEGKSGMITIAGGKLSAYRKMAERVVDRVKERLGAKTAKSRTFEEPLPGGGKSPHELRLDIRLANIDNEVRLKRLTRLYGDEIFNLMEHGGGVEAEVIHGVTHEGALRLVDFWVRRSARAWFADGARHEAMKLAALKMKNMLGWSDAREKLELEACEQIHNESLSFQNSNLR